MPALQVRDFPDALYDNLKESAARNQRSIARQAVVLIESGLHAAPAPAPVRDTRNVREGVGSSADRIDRRRAIFERLDELSAPLRIEPISAERIVADIRQDHDARDARIVAAAEGLDR